MNVSTSCTSPAKVPSACLWFCSMSLFTSFTNQSKMSQMAGHWFCSIISSKISCTNFGDKVLDFVACFQERSDFPLQNQEPIQYMLGNNGFRGTILYRIKVHYRIKIWWIQRKTVLWKWYYCRIKNLNSTSDFPIQYQKPIHVGQQGFQGTILFRIKDLRRSPAFFLQNQSHSQSIKSLGPQGLQNQDRTGVQPKMGDFWVFASRWSLIL